MDMDCEKTCFAVSEANMSPLVRRQNSFRAIATRTVATTVSKTKASLYKRNLPAKAGDTRSPRNKNSQGRGRKFPQSFRSSSTSGRRDQSSTEGVHGPSLLASALPKQSFYSPMDFEWPRAVLMVPLRTAMGLVGGLRCKAIR